MTIALPTFVATLVISTVASEPTPEDDYGRGVGLMSPPSAM